MRDPSLCNGHRISYPNSRVSKTLLAWYRQHRRILPWRENPDPYHIWISEIMLQQTQVETVIPYYHRFLERFPTVEALAAAPAGDVLKAWENLGYYARARHLHQAAKKVVETHGGKIPDTRESLLALPGIGPYTAGAILSMAFRQQTPAVDGNVRRVVIRLFALDAPGDRPEIQKTLQNLVALLIPRRSPGSFNQALMDLGAMICIPKTPACVACPLKALCRARLAGLQEILPLSSKKPPKPCRRAVAAVIRNRQGRILIVQRPERGLLASLWKFPGGVMNDEESLTDGLKRMVYEELGIRIQVGDQISTVQHAYTHFRVILHAFRCTRRSGYLHACGCQDWRWAFPDEMVNLTFSKVDRAIISAIRL